MVFKSGYTFGPRWRHRKTQKSLRTAHNHTPARGAIRPEANLRLDKQQLHKQQMNNTGEAGRMETQWRWHPRQPPASPSLGHSEKTGLKGDPLQFNQ